MRMVIRGLLQLEEEVAQYLAMDPDVLSEQFLGPCYWALAATASLDNALGRVKLSYPGTYDFAHTLREFDYRATYFTEPFILPDHEDIRRNYEVVPSGHLSSLAKEAWDRMHQANYIDGLFCLSLLVGILLSSGGVTDYYQRPDLSPIMPAFQPLKHALAGTKPAAQVEKPITPSTYTLALHFAKQLPEFHFYARGRPSSLLNYYSGYEYDKLSDRDLSLALAQLISPDADGRGVVLETDAVGPILSALSLVLADVAFTTDEKRISALIRPWRNRILTAAKAATAQLSKEDRTAFALIDLVQRRETRVTHYQAALGEGAALEARDENGKTALMHAASVPGNAKVIQFLAREGADLEAVDYSGASPITAAAKFHDDPRTMAALLAAAKPEQAKRMIQMALTHTVESRAPENLAWLVVASANTDPSLPREEALLFNAVQYGWVKGVSILVEAGANVNASCDGGTTPLILACQNKSKAIVDALIAAGADVNLTDDSALTALMHASREGAVGCIHALVAAGADLDARSGSGCTALMFAAHRGGGDAVEALAKAGANVDAQDKYGLTALMYACHPPYGYYSPHQIAPLLAAGANLEVKDRQGRTVLMHADVSGAVEMLLDAGADVEAIDNEGTTADKYLEGSGAEISSDDIWYEFRLEEEIGWAPE